MNSNDLIVNVGKNSNDTAALVWSVADDLVGAYKPHEYGLVKICECFLYCVISVSAVLG